MNVPNGYHDVDAGKLANVATSLEMFGPPAPRADPQVACTLVRVSEAGAAWYRALFASIGEPYLWSSRLAMNDDELLKIIHDPRVEVYAVRDAEGDAGFLELDFRVDGECEIGFFGLHERSIGTGAGRWLMNRALERAWAAGIKRVWVHTCNLDHPSALAFYIRSGFVPFKRQIEVYDDPRVTGIQPRDAAPGVPVL
jgi:GNAT superfamily N-acetyltransferase